MSNYYVDNKILHTRTDSDTDERTKSRPSTSAGATTTDLKFQGGFVKQESGAHRELPLGEVFGDIKDILFKGASSPHPPVFSMPGLEQERGRQL